ncbi:C2H2-type domain-containing protein [Mycena venus]|uniref:C2H2-type domain-containing protein n=1 Tax=Mycena venus TaxID=2733690 RepID=A0A8H6YEI0_9AGAR|nr:C2H2-type domain-containing protein [Mycena venus]
MLSSQHPSASLLHLPSFDLPLNHDPQAVPRSSSDLFLHHIACLDEPLSRPSSGTVDDEPSPVSPSGPNYHYGAPPPLPLSGGFLRLPPRPILPPYPYSSDLRRAPSFRAPSPSPIDAPQPLSAPHDQDRFPISAYPAGSRLDSLSDRQPRYGLLPKISTLTLQLLSSAPITNSTALLITTTSLPTPPESPFIPRVASLGSLRQDYAGQGWKDNVGDVSPFQASFSAGISGSPPLYSQQQQQQADSPGDSSNKKTYSFVALPGNAVRKRPRRRYDEIERLYHCSWPDCNKAYGTLNHLNAHVQMQKHGPKRSPNEFKELRKQWRKAKKEYESPGLGPIRRSMSLRRDDLYSPGQHHSYTAGHGQGHHRSFSHNSALSPQLSVSIPHLRQDASYPVDHHALRYPPDNRGEIDPQGVGYAGLDFRQPPQGHGHGGAPTAWPGPSSSRGAADIYQSPLSATSAYNPYLETHAAAAQMMESPPPHVGDPYHSPTRTTSSMNRLPPDSMLLTPLVASGQVGDSSYGAGAGTEAYYDSSADNKAQRSGRHPSSTDQGSGDEY